MLRSLCACLILTGVLAAQESPLDFTVLDADSQEVSLRDFEGQVLLIVNVASRCGLAPQYAKLQELQESYGEQGFTVLGFPANDFLGQEPGSNQEIQQFCREEYGVSFPVFAKIAVKGDRQHPLYAFLTEQTPRKLQGTVRWNFDKFLVAKDGSVCERFSPTTSPTARKVRAAIDAELARD